MITRNGVDSFAELPADEQARLRVVGREMVRLAETHAVPIVFGAPAWQHGKFNSASGCLVKVGARTFVVSAAHVLDAFEAERRAADQVIWQVGNFGFDPTGRVAWQDKQLDIVLLELAQSEIARVGSHTLSVPPADLDYGGWSGGPVFLVGDLAYPLVGVVSQFQGTYELLRIALVNSVNLPA